MATTPRKKPGTGGLSGGTVGGGGSSGQNIQVLQQFILDIPVQVTYIFSCVNRASALIVSDSNSFDSGFGFSILG
jgi:hypothetical protein